ncbi:hypothetical protein CZ674_11745 [Agrococcus casei LMG 22410]|uniref:Uncharacterized protein n=1 Tax=Agrococcus casei LMG 22410 TaxID=1255656 RepID=A0A1R4GGI1_9MICO|nr:hypothetical protein CZ674_11745 [Agrococcus casei LMG 22410]
MHEQPQVLRFLVTLRFLVAQLPATKQTQAKPQQPYRSAVTSPDS